MSQPVTAALDYWTLGLALLGAVTGVAALVTQVWGLVLSGPRVKVSVANAFVPGVNGWFLSVDASNVGRLPVTVLELGVTFNSGGQWRRVPFAALPVGTSQGPPMPHRLNDGDAATWLVESGLLAGAVGQHGVTDVHGYVRLASGRTLRSRNAIDVANLATLK